MYFHQLSLHCFARTLQERLGGQHLLTKGEGWKTLECKTTRARAEGTYTEHFNIRVWQVLWKELRKVLSKFTKGKTNWAKRSRKNGEWILEKQVYVQSANLHSTDQNETECDSHPAMLVTSQEQCSTHVNVKILKLRVWNLIWQFIRSILLYDIIVVFILVEEDQH